MKILGWWNMPDINWILENCLLERDNGIWAGEKQFTYSDGENNVYYVNRRRDGSMYVHSKSKRYGGESVTGTTTTYVQHEKRRKKKVEEWYFG